MSHGLHHTSQPLHTYWSATQSLDIPAGGFSPSSMMAVVMPIAVGALERREEVALAVIRLTARLPSSSRVSPSSLAGVEVGRGGGGGGGEH